MFTRLLMCFALAVGVNAFAAEDAAQPLVDLRDAAAIERLQQTRPEHYHKIRRAMDALTRQPLLAEGQWLQTNVGARDVDLSRYVLRTSHPPRQLLRFTIDDTRYLMHLVRTDMVGTMQPAQ